MRKRFMTHSAIGAVTLLAWSLLGTVPASQATNSDTVKFISTDEPGPWYKCVSTYGCIDARSSPWPLLSRAIQFRLTMDGEPITRG